MIPRSRGKIVNIGSLGSELARATVAPYTAAKGGIKNLTRSMAVEWAPARHPGQRHRPRLHADRHERGAGQQPDFNDWLMGARPPSAGAGRTS